MFLEIGHIALLQYLFVFLKETEDFGDWTHCQGRISAIFLSKQTKVVGCMTDVAPSQDLEMQVVLLVHRKIKYRIL